MVACILIYNRNLIHHVGLPQNLQIEYELMHILGHFSSTLRSYYEFSDPVFGWTEQR